MTTTPDPPSSWEPSEEDLQSFQAHLRVLLDERGWSQNQLESEAGFARGTLSKIFGGKLRVHRRHLVELARALGLTDLALAGGTALEPLLSQPVPTPDSEALISAHSRINALEQELSGLRAELEGERRATKELLEHTRALAEERGDAERSHRAKEQLGAELAALRDAHDALASEREALREQLAAANAHIARLKADLGSVRLQGARSDKERARLASEVERLHSEVKAAQEGERGAAQRAQVATRGAERASAQAEQAKKQANEWARHAADETSRADQLQQLLWRIEEKARESAVAATTAQRAADSKVSPGATFLLTLAGLGLGMALADEGKPKRRY